MTTHLQRVFLTPFQQIFTFFCVLIAQICIFLFFLTLASKYQKLLITPQMFCFNSTKYSQTFAGKNPPIFRKFKPNRQIKLFLWRDSDTKTSFEAERNF